MVYKVSTHVYRGYRIKGQMNEWMNMHGLLLKKYSKSHILKQVIGETGIIINPKPCHHDTSRKALDGHGIYHQDSLKWCSKSTSSWKMMLEGTKMINIRWNSVSFHEIQFLQHCAPHCIALKRQISFPQLRFSFVPRSFLGGGGWRRVVKLNTLAILSLLHLVFWLPDHSDLYLCPLTDNKKF